MLKNVELCYSNYSVCEVIEMNDELKSEFIKKHYAFISQDEFTKLLESPDQTSSSVDLKNLVHNYKESLERLDGISTEIQTLINSSVENSLEKIKNKYEKKIEKKNYKLEKLGSKNRTYPIDVKRYHLGLSAGAGSAVILIGASLLGLIYVGPNPELWPTALLLTNSAVSLTAAVPAFFGVRHALKKSFANKRQTILNRKRSIAKKMMLSSYQKESQVEQQLSSLKNDYSDKQSELNLLKLSIDSKVRTLLDKGTNRFFDKHELLSEEFSLLPDKDKEKLVSLVKSLEEKKVHVEKSNMTLQEMSTKKVGTIQEVTQQIPQQEAEQLTINFVELSTKEKVESEKVKQRNKKKSDENNKKQEKKAVTR